MVLSLAVTGVVRCQGGLADASLEQLLNIQVTSVSKKEQKLARTAAAIFVIQQDDIRRSGATNLPDVLRTAPGVEVLRVDANSWAISIRGFNSRYADKVLVLIDGRSVYTTTFSGVYWEQIDVPLEEIERIEVIRGPGATIWGANAVNGVINIITRHSRAVQGGLVSAAAGSHVAGDGMVRYGGAVGRGGGYRVFGRFLNERSMPLADGTSGADHWTRAHGGFRTDWEVSGRDSISVEGDVFSNRQGQVSRVSPLETASGLSATERFPVSGGSVTGRWSHSLWGGSHLEVQAYYQGFRRDEFEAREEEQVADFSLQHHVALGSRHDVVWGLGHRRSTTGLAARDALAASFPSRTDNLYSGFFQDEVQVARLVWFTYGCKVEHNAYTGWEYEPSLRLAWTPSASTTLWAAASRAIRQPARGDTSLTLQAPPLPTDSSPVEGFSISGNPRLKAEEVRDFELGYRTQLAKRASLDIATFLSFYRHLTTLEPGSPQKDIQSSPAYVTVPMTYDNLASALNFGGEISLSLSPASGWRVGPAYSLLRQNMDFDPLSRDTLMRAHWRGNPEHIFRIASYWDVTPNLKFDQSLVWVAGLPGTGIGRHARLDARLARRVGETTEVSVVGQNLLRPATLEFLDRTTVFSTQAVRSVYGKITWTF